MSAEQAGAEIVMMVNAVVRALVEAPDDSCVLARFEDGWVRVNISVPPDDLGKVLGRSGKTIRSLRSIVQAVSSKNKVRCELNVYETRGAA